MEGPDGILEMIEDIGVVFRLGIAIISLRAVELGPI